MSRRMAFCGVAIAAILLIGVAMQAVPKGANMMQQVNQEKWPFTLPELPFAYGALEPNIDARTVEIHYSRHHRAYVEALNKAVSSTSWKNKTLLELFKQASSLPKSIRNNAGGHFNHAFYWSIMRSPVNNPGPSTRLVRVLTEAFGSFEAFKAQFREFGLTHLGSGWTWLVRLPDGSLKIYASLNQDNPLMDTSEVQGRPLLTCDVWEHAYYLKYLNRRDEYMDAFWNLVDWQRVEELLNQKL